jgi:hypothetical protein
MKHNILYVVTYRTPHLPGVAIVYAASPAEAVALARSAPDPNDPNCKLEREDLDVEPLTKSDSSAVLYDFCHEE